jgi:hypothetical protein
MANPIIVYQNLWRDGTILAVTTEAAQFPAEYTQDDSPQLFWRSTAKADEQDIDCDLGAAHEYDFVVLLNHNLTSAATIIIYGADDAAFTSNVVHDHLTHNGNNIYEILPGVQTKRYVRISLLNAANPQSYLRVGTIVVGKSNTLNRGPSVPYRRGLTNETEVERSPSANLFTVQERPSLNIKSLPFTGLDAASELVVEALLRACGSHVAFVLCLDSGTPNSNSYWVHLTGQEPPECQHLSYWNWTAEIEEII